MNAAQRNHLARSLLPDTAFRHIGIMVMFMAVLMMFAGFGFVAVSGIIQGWTQDIDNTMTVEIPAYDAATGHLVDEQALDDAVQNILDSLAYDPAVLSAQPVSVQDLKERMTLSAATFPKAGGEYGIPLPRFITLRLHPDRAAGTIDRLSANIRSTGQNIIVKTHRDWLADIHETAFILRAVFGGLAVSILIVTGFIITGVVRTQLKASADTVTLFHLMGAQSFIIASLFQKAVLSPVGKGALIGMIAALLAVLPVAALMNFNPYSLNIWLLAPITFLLFMTLAALTTQITVLSNLREAP